jgi:DOPA 4,5-dioxygenase
MIDATTWHAHVYFDATTLEQARRLCGDCHERFAVPMGRVHEQPVGPHPDWSCQLTIDVEQLGEVLTWLALHREGLVVFCHPNTGDPLKDHTDHTVWLGAIRPLDVTQFRNARDS